MHFGPAGNSDSFYAQGYGHSYEAPAWLHGMGLDAYEYSFGRGVNLSLESAERIALEAKKEGVCVSVHAPYYINLANPDADKAEKSLQYILKSATVLRALGGDRMVVHVGAQMKLERPEALRLCRERLMFAAERMDDIGLGDIHLCPETMGKHSQIGDLEEILSLCTLRDTFVPCIDFAHLHALTGGGLKDTESFAAVLDTLESVMGKERAAKLHIHFSTIEFTAAGEKQHRTFAETEYGPRFEYLAPLLKARGYDAVVICECKGTMAEDAFAMKNIYAAL